MIELQGIYTNRNTPHPHYWDIVYEWEDEFSKILNVPLVQVGEKYDQIYQPNVFKKILNRFNAYQLADKYRIPTGHYVAFHIGPPGAFSFYTRRNVIPIIIDFWKYEDLSRFEKIFSLSPCVFVTSREVYNYLTEKKVNLQVQLLSLSLPDKYFFDNTKIIKDIDIIQIGRRNAELDSYAVKLLQEFPETHYVSGEKIDGNLHLVSNKLGDMGVFEKRTSFIDLLRRSKISLVSAPGLDESDKRTGGFSPVTPRFLESVACQCHLIGIYPDNDDFKHYGISEICQSVQSYEEFKRQAIHYLSKTHPDYSQFLRKHLTSERANELKIKLSKLNEQ
jgi:hypothetical protein